jgi:hypothetical protein
VLPSTGHVYLHRLWALATERAESSLGETLHLLNCSECQRNLYACFQVDTFGAALRVLDREDDTPHHAKAV